MIFPSVDRLAEKVESRYTLVILAAKRAKQLREGAPKLVETTSTNPLTIALEEIAAGKVTYSVPSHDEVPAREIDPELAGVPAIEAPDEEAAEIVSEAAPVDEAARVAQLLEVPVEQEESSEETAEEPEAVVDDGEALATEETTAPDEELQAEQTEEE